MSNKRSANILSTLIVSYTLLFAYLALVPNPVRLGFLDRATFNLNPQSNVEWLSGRNGLLLTKNPYLHISLIPDDADETAFPQKEGTIELYFQGVERFYSTQATLMSFCNDEDYCVLAIDQLHQTLNVRTSHDVRNAPISIPFNSTDKVLLTLTTKEKVAELYLNGELIKKIERSLLSKKTNTVETLILGNSMRADQPWKGKILGLAVHDSYFTGARVRKGYEAWIKGNTSDALGFDGDRTLAFAFTERSGSVAASTDNRFRCIMPENAIPLTKVLLQSNWDSYRTFNQDIILNVLIFIPLGFLLTLLLGHILRIRFIPTILISLVYGIATSLTIELIQTVEPTRVSSALDLVNNTLGLVVGIGLAYLVRYLRGLSLKSRTHADPA